MSADVVVLAHARDRRMARAVGKSLGMHGFRQRVWTAGSPPAAASRLREDVSRAGKVVVCWSQAAAASGWMDELASGSAARGALVPLTLDGTIGETGWRSIQITNFQRWTAAPFSPEIDLLAAGVVQDARLIDQETVEQASNASEPAVGAGAPTAGAKRKSGPMRAALLILFSVLGIGLAIAFAAMLAGALTGPDTLSDASLAMAVLFGVAVAISVWAATIPAALLPKAGAGAAALWGLAGVIIGSYAAFVVWALAAWIYANTQAGIPPDALFLSLPVLMVVFAPLAAWLLRRSWLGGTARLSHWRERRAAALLNSLLRRAAPADTGVTGKAYRPHDVFISYRRQDRPLAQAVGSALERRGLKVWWDKSLVAGEKYAPRILAELMSARTVVLCWTSRAAASPWVRAEARLAAQRNVLIPLMFDEAAPPEEWREAKSVDMKKWRLAPFGPEASRLAEAVRSGREAPPQPTEVANVFDLRTHEPLGGEATPATPAPEPKGKERARRTRTARLIVTSAVLTPVAYFTLLAVRMAFGYSLSGATLFDEIGQEMEGGGLRSVMIDGAILSDMSVSVITSALVALCLLSLLGASAAAASLIRHGWIGAIGWAVLGIAVASLLAQYVMVLAALVGVAIIAPIPLPTELKVPALLAPMMFAGFGMSQPWVTTGAMVGLAPIMTVILRGAFNSVVARVGFRTRRAA